MGQLFALGDLHLSTLGDKPMGVFGELWRDHTRRMAEAWDDTVRDGDTILLAGDLSWAKTLDEAAGDLAWIAARPGHKILLRGNHDSWWSSIAKVRRRLPPGCVALHHDAQEIDGRAVVVGSRGWLAPGDPVATPEDARVFLRELERLRMSIADADRRFGRARPRVGLLHYPPWLEGSEPTEVVAVLREAEVEHVVYGHLHGDDHRLAVRGEREGAWYHFVAADAVGFTPVPIPC